MEKICYVDVEVSNRWNDYVECRDKGLKKLANEKLKLMIEYLNSKSRDEKKRFVTFICTEKFEKKKDIELQQPIIQDLILPILQEGVSRKEMPELRWIFEVLRSSNCNYKEIGNIDYYVSEEILLQANQRDPDDIKTVLLLLNMYVGELNYGCHHFPFGILIEEKEVKELLDKSKELLAKYGTRIENEKVIFEEIQYYKDIYNLWFLFQSEKREISFEKWCELNNKKHLGYRLFDCLID